MRTKEKNVTRAGSSRIEGAKPPQLGLQADPLVEKAVSLLVEAFENSSHIFRGSWFGRNQFITDFGSLCRPFYSKSLEVCFDLGIDENVKALVSRALLGQGFPNIHFSIIDSYRDRNGQEHGDELAHINFAFDSVIENASIEDRQLLVKMILEYDR